MPFDLSFGKLRAGCFGKLSWLADYFYVSSRKDRAEENLCSLITEMGDALSRPPHKQGPRCRSSYRFFLADGEDGTGLTTWLWDSGDRSGRRAPFTLFATSPTRILKGPACALPFAQDPIWEILLAATQIDQKPWPLFDKATVLPTKEMTRIIEELRIAKPKQRWDRKDVETKLEGHTARPFLEDLFPGGSAGDCFARVLWYIREEFARDQGIPRYSAFRFPSARRESPLLQAAFWLYVLEGEAGGALPLLPSILIPQEDADEAGGIWVLFRQPSGRDSLVLFMAEPTHDGLLDLTHFGGTLDRDPEPSSFASFAGRVKGAIREATTALDLARITDTSAVPKV